MDYDYLEETHPDIYEDLLDNFSFDPDDDLPFYEPEQPDNAFFSFFGSIFRQVWPNIGMSLTLCIAWRLCHVLFRRHLTPNRTAGMSKFDAFRVQPVSVIDSRGHSSCTVHFLWNHSSMAFLRETDV